MKFTRLLALVLSTFAIVAPVHAALYAARSGGGAGELYIISASDGSLITDIGPTNDALGDNYPITGLAFDPCNGIQFGSTSNSNPTHQAQLVTINPATALVTAIGDFNAGPTNTAGDPSTMADIEFDAAGNLFGVGSIGGPQLYSI